MQESATILSLHGKSDRPGDASALESVFQAQKEQFRLYPFPEKEERIHHLNRLKKGLLRYKEDIGAAINDDFGARSRDETFLAELISAVDGIKYAVKHIKKWMKPSRRMPGLIYMPAWAKVHYQPLGVVGIVSPWNYPVYLSVGGPLVCALAAGNRAILRMSRSTPNTSAVLKHLIRETFHENYVSLFTGDDVSGQEFTAKAWDHLVFTGSTVAGQDVMRAAADHLTPVTLELGGKSPAIIGKEIPMKDPAQRIAWGKCINAGQTCVAPDYVLCPDTRVDEFIQRFRTQVHRMYPTMRSNPDYTAIENDQQYAHLNRLIQDAITKGAEVVVINPGNEDFSGGRKLPPHILKNVTDDMLVMQKEIFGPVLPVVPYETLADALRYVNSRPRPLALYFFDYNTDAADYIIRNTHSGGVLINDTMVHVPQKSLPFGGIGQSGMGQYHGHAGFLTFSKQKGVLVKPKWNSTRLIYPPYGGVVHRLLYKWLLR